MFSNSRRAHWIGLALAPIVMVVWVVRSMPAAIPVTGLLTAAAFAEPTDPLREPLASPMSPALSDIAQQDPIALARRGLERYQREIHDYRCVFLKQERIKGKLRPVEQIEVRFRESPTSVYMIWQINADQARRALFIDSPEYRDKKNRRVARVEPNGAIARLFVKDINIRIDGPEARKTSRRTIAEFGFKSTFGLLERYNRLGRERGVLDFHYDGEGTIDGRPTYIFVRKFPYEGPKGPYPDALMILHLDREWLLPTAVYSYADHEGKKLLGSYVFTQVELNPGLNDADFQF